MPSLDIFKADAFSMLSLTDRVNKMPFVPGKAGQLGIFTEQGINTTDVAIEEYAGSLALIPNTQRGAPANQNQHNKRTVRKLSTPFLPLEDVILAHEIQNIRAFGSDSELQAVMGVVDQRLLEMNAKHDATVEYGRIGAIKGLILDSDGATTIYNLFTEFGVAQTSIDFVLGTATTDVLGKITDAKGAIEDELGMLTYEDMHVFCGKVWWKEFITHSKVTNAYQYFEARQQDRNPLREDLRYKGFRFGDATFEQYRGNVGGIPFIADNEAYAFPVGVPGLFKTVYAPGDFVETANTIGLPRYVKIALDPMLGRYVVVHTQSSPLSYCTRPKTLIKFTTSN